MAELVYAHALGACPERGGGSNPLPPILLRLNTFVFKLRSNAATKRILSVLAQARSRAGFVKLFSRLTSPDSPAKRSLAINLQKRRRTSSFSSFLKNTES